MKKLFFSLIALLFLVGCQSGKYEKVKPENGIVKIPVSKVSDGIIHYYEFENNGRPVKFFVLQDNNGTIRAAFDACDVCYPEKKGYRQEGDFVVCNNCGQKFHESKINEVRGGCNPAPLDRKINGQYLEIQVADIKKGAFYF
ncbi:DUF2318 domain-containing protein [Deferribacteraceae bacterium V6Fe1]|nr:DUF2318 domain-containing protein [Deferribacteraceae bacterium V6Fe1]